MWAFVPCVSQCRPLLHRSGHHHPAVNEDGQKRKKQNKINWLMQLLSGKYAQKKDTYLAEQQLVKHFHNEKSPVDVKPQ